jgi:hypothetical protein
MDDRRAVLEAIAYGDDPRLTPGERLRALEVLADLDTRERQEHSSPELTAEAARVLADEPDRIALLFGLALDCGLLDAPIRERAERRAVEMFDRQRAESLHAVEVSRGKRSEPQPNEERATPSEGLPRKPRTSGLLCG